MNLNITFNLDIIKRLQKTMETWPWERIISITAVILAILATAYSYKINAIVSYGDAESHLNIAKRVVSGLTPGMAQLGGIWLPLLHILMAPLVSVDFLWRSGLAGSVISGISYVVSAIILYKLTLRLTKNLAASIVAFIIFATNPNILYLQSTPLDAVIFIALFLLSSYFFVKYLQKDQEYLSLILAAFFGFASTLTRYDGWFLVLFELFIVLVPFVYKRKFWKQYEGRAILFSTLAFFGVFIWFLWDMAILGDPLYFTHSQFSAKSQQQAWLVRGELPAYKNLPVAFLYYTVTTMGDMGIILFGMAVIGLILYIRSKNNNLRWYILILLFSPFILNVYTLFAGQTVIFIPDVTPVSFEWRLFNVRYGVTMVAVLAFFIAYLFYKSKLPGKLLITFLFICQFGLFFIGYTPVITLQDGLIGLSAGTKPNSSYWKWLRDHYDGGLVMIDDYARTVSIIKSGIPMQDIIYVGTKPYWEQSFQAPEKYARWIIMQKNDDVWKGIYDKPQIRARLYKYFQKVYTSPEILIFKRDDNVQASK